MTSNATTLLSAVHDYLTWARDHKRLRDLTLRIYRHTLVAYVEWLGDRTIDSVTSDDVERFAARRRRNGPPSAATARRDVVAVRMFHKWAVSKGRTTSADAMEAVAPSTPPRSPKPVDDLVWKELWGSTMSRDDRVWLGLGYFAGLRRFEIVTMAPSAVEPHNRLLKFERKGGGTSPVEYVAMCEVVNDSMPWLTVGWEAWTVDLATLAEERKGEAHLSPQSTGDSFLDGNRLNKRLSRLCEQAGLPATLVTPHMLRHSCATNLHRAGVDIAVIADLLSHASINTTRSYLKTSGQLDRWRNRTGLK